MFSGVLRSFKEAFAAGAGYWVASTLGVQGIAYLAQIIVGHILPPEDFGVVRTVESYLAVLLMVGTLGIPSATYRLGAVTPIEEKRSLIGNAIALTLLGAIVTTGFTILCCRSFPILVPGRTGRFLELIAPCVICGAVARTVIAYHQGCLQLKTVSYLSIVPALIMIGGLIVLVKTYSLPGWVGARLIAEVIGFLLVLVSVGKCALLPWKVSHVRSIFSLAVPSLCAHSLDKLLAGAELFVLDRYATERSQVGTYGAATMLAAVLLLPTGALNAASFNRIAQSTNTVSHSLAHLRTLVAGTILITFPAAVGFIVLGQKSMQLVFGPQYILSLSVIAIIGVSLLLRGLVVSYGSYVLAIGRPLMSVYANAAGLGVVVAASFILIPTHGMLGAALASLGGVLSRLLVLVVSSYST